MYGSYGSYSSMCASRPMDIASNNFHTQDEACAFPSWPRRSSLDSEEAQRPTSFLSDDDLFFCDNPIEDDCSVSSSSSSSASTSPRQQLTQAELMEMERERMVLQRELVRQTLMEKERRKQARRVARKQGDKKLSPKSKRSNMAPIAE